jgi:hypothetical protein
LDGIRKNAGLNSFTLTPRQWIERTGALGLVSKDGPYGGTYAHKDIAFEFASWISVEFKLYLIKEFQRLKEQEHKTLGWGIRHILAMLRLKYDSMYDAELDLGKPAEIGKVFAGFQKYLYQRGAEVA